MIMNKRVSDSIVEIAHVVRPTDLNNVIIGKITYVGRTSMEIKVESYAEHIDGTRELINRAYLTMVALDDNGKPAKVPELILEEEEEIEENENAKVRREMRKRV